MAKLATPLAELVPVDQLESHPSNPRVGDVDVIGESIRSHGFYGAIVAQRSTKRILAGNHRWQAAKAEGIAEVPVMWLDVDDDEALRVLLVDNRANDQAGYDDAQLAFLLEDLAASQQGLDGTGYDDAALTSLLASLGDTWSGHDYTMKVESPIYAPSGEPPPVATLTDTQRRDELAAEIAVADLPDDVRMFLSLAAERHIRFDYQAIADYYAHADDATKRLIERSALVIIDYDQAIAQGFVRLHEDVTAAFQADHPDA